MNDWNEVAEARWSEDYEMRRDAQREYLEELAGMDDFDDVLGAA